MTPCCRWLRVVAAGLLLAAAAQAQPTAADQAAPRLQTPAGQLEGAQADGSHVYRGIPYARPPLGARRWQPPQPLPPWAGVRQARANGASCIQKPVPSLEGGGDPGPLREDCLFLNVWAPSAAAAGPRPVLVWLHGGALVQGAGGLAIYDGAALARQGLVVVTVNYRLGPLGYFNHPALEATSPGGAMNFGLLDQIAALRWVQRHIAAFGGDPGQVTVAGQSAGAQSVLALMASPLARGLFQRAIAQSPYGIPSHSRAQARAVGSKLASVVGLPGARASLAQLRAVPAQRLVGLDGLALSLAPSLIVGDAALPQALLPAFQAGRQAAVPLLIGSNSDEASVALAFGLQPAALVQKLGAARILVRPLYPGVHDDADLGRQVVRDVAFTAFARRVSVLQAARAPVWRYHFDRPAAAVRGSQPGVAHGGEIPAVFGTGDLCQCLGVPLSDADRLAWQGVSARWAAFVRGGPPDAGAGPTWPADSRWKPVVLQFGETETVEADFMRQRLDSLIVGLNLAGWIGERR
jgi:para-nitrobenzyl esterase